MAEYIEREKAKEELLSWAVCINHPEHLLREDAMCVIDNIPAADVEVVKHGRWLPQVLLGKRVVDCSECKTLGSPHWKRCPVCEAKMEVTNGLDQH